MEVAIGILGAALAFLGIILAYMWRTNGRYLMELQAGQKELQAGQKELQAGQREIAKGIGGIAQLGRVIALYYFIQLRRTEVSPDLTDVYKELERIVKGSP